MDSYKDLKVWQQAVELAVNCYECTSGFPKQELFGLTGQIRRSATSIAANIAEGHGRESAGSFIQFLRISQGSLKELETHLLIARRVGLLPVGEAELLDGRCNDIGKMVRALIRSLQGSSR
ncbi:four helix bundle protein [Rhizobiaceae bacterium CRRU44]|uniref:Four helix bundle protein n=1 Tax=Ferranicluibacter rubi TaxID=2715133 RepID=A0AA43ZDH4_9HYPH|nr:four helix bundle protein [Ferranicluibacter rubi]